MIRLQTALCTLIFLVGFSKQALGDQVREDALPEYLVVDVPAQWAYLPGLSGKLAVNAMDADFFGEENVQAGAAAYGRANRGALYITWIDSLRPVVGAPSSLRLAFDSIHEAPFLANLEAGVVQELSYRERSFDGVAEMTFEWSHLENNTVNLTRAIGWSDGDTGILHLGIAECVIPNQDAEQSRPDCEHSLTSLRLGPDSKIKKIGALSVPKRVGVLPETLEVPELKTGIPQATLSPAPTTPGKVLYEGPGAPKKSDNSNRLIIAVGVILLGIAAWLTTRSRGSDKDDDKSDSDEQETE